MNKFDRIKQLYSKKPQKKEEQQQVRPNKKHISNYLTPVKIPGLLKPLYDFQIKAVTFLDYKLKIDQRAILGDDMGLGKTAEALAYLQLHPELRPAIIVAPHKFNWAKECFYWMERREENRVFITASRKENKQLWEASMFGNGKLHLEPTRKRPKTGIIIANYEILPNELYDTGELDKNDKPILKEIPLTGWVDYFCRMGVIVITDESQYYKNDEAQRTKAIKKLAKAIDYFIPLTGTLIEKRPIEMYNAVHIVDKKLFPSKWKFQMRYCNPKNNGFGWNFNGASNMTELFNKLQTIMIRRKKEDKEIGLELPTKRRVVIPMELSNYAEYEKADIDFMKWIKENLGRGKHERSARAKAFARIEILNKLAIKGKMKSCLQWMEDYIDYEGKLVVIAVKTDTIDSVCKHFGKNALRIDGTINKKQQQEAQDEFQRNPKINVITLQLQAAVGWTLTASQATCTLELFRNPGKHDQAEDRVLRIGAKGEHVFAYYLLGLNTIEEEVNDIINEERKVVSAVLDGKEIEMDSFMSRLLKKKGADYERTRY